MKNDLGLDDYDIKKLIYNDHFIKAVASIRDEYGMPNTGYEDETERYIWLESLTDEKAANYKFAIEKLMTRFELTQKWRFALRLYIEKDNVNLLRAKSNFEIKYTYRQDEDKQKDVDKISISVDPSVTAKELESAHKSVVKLRKEALHYKKDQPAYSIDRDKKITDKYDELKDYEKTTQWANDNLHVNLDRGAIKVIIRRTKKLLSKGQPSSD